MFTAIMGAASTPLGYAMLAHIELAFVPSVDFQIFKHKPKCAREPRFWFQW